MVAGRKAPPYGYRTPIFGPKASSENPIWKIEGAGRETAFTYENSLRDNPSWDTDAPGVNTL